MTLTELNHLSKTEQTASLEKCCGAAAWVQKMMAQFPFADKASLLKVAATQWWQCKPADWLEAFTHHPRIGSRETLAKKFSATVHWTVNEQQGTHGADENTIDALLAGNDAYEKKFGFIFIVCATGKSAAEMLALLQARLLNEKGTEIRLAAAEQNKITILRLEKLLA
ncbi:MAG: 2-oxo-4-hydroxy-4-carboxy-5-ureidoimidazoline decarboxylase [Chitinophagaceae bacterium]